MKILLVNIDKGWGGGQEHLAVLAGELRSSGCAPHFLCRAHSPSAQNFAAQGFPVWPIWGSGLLRALRETAALLRRERFDAIMVTREHDLFRTVLARKLAFPFGNAGKLVVSYHTATARRQLFLGAADAVVCVSSFIRDRLLARHNRLGPRTVVINNGIPVVDEPSAEKFTLQRQRRFFQGTGFPLIGMVGAFFKNQGELLEVVSLVKREFPEIKVALVGDDTDVGLTAPLVEKAERLGVAENVIITGKVPHERMTDIYFDLDLSVSTFRNEGFGLVHLESLAAGTPVVAYNEGGKVDILQGNAAGVIVAGGPAEFAAEVTALLRDHGRRFAMGRRGVDLVQDSFSVAAMGRSYVKLCRAFRRFTR